MSINPSACLPACQPASLLTCPPASQPAYLPANQPACHCACAHFCHPAYLTAHPRAMCPCYVCLSIYLFTYSSVCLSIRPFVCKSPPLSFSQSAYVLASFPVCLPACRPNCPLTCPYVHLSVCPHISIFEHMSVCTYIHPSVCLTAICSPLAFCLHLMLNLSKMHAMHF